MTEHEPNYDAGVVGQNRLERQESYEDFLAGELGPQSEQPWEIRDDSTASWALRQIAAAEALVASREATIAVEQDRLWRWVDQARSQAVAVRGFFEGKLRGYAERLREAGKFGRRKSWLLPNGALQYTAYGVDYEIKDEPAFTAWAATQQDLTETVVKVKWAEAKKQMRPAGDGVGSAVVAEHIDRQTGEVTEIPVPGVLVSRVPGERFRVNVTDED